MGDCVITEVLDSWFKYECPATTKKSGVEMTGIDMWWDGRTYHDDAYPTMFNTRAQFKAYWDEVILNGLSFIH